MNIVSIIKNKFCNQHNLVDKTMALKNLKTLCLKKHIDIHNIADMGKDVYFVVPVPKQIVFDNAIHGYLYDAKLNTLKKYVICDALVNGAKMNWIDNRFND